MANRAKLTPQKRGKFLQRLAETANVSNAAKYCGITRSAAYKLRGQDEEFKAAWDEAVEIATDALEEEARRRALQGVTKPVYYQGARCGELQEYSDTLMIVLLKANRPEKYKDRSETDHKSSDGSMTPKGVQLSPETAEMLNYRHDGSKEEPKTVTE